MMYLRRLLAAFILFASVLILCGDTYGKRFTYISPPNADEAAVLDAVNEVRVSLGLDALTFDPALTHTARIRASQMAATQMLSHTTCDGSNVFDMMRRDHIRYRVAGENLARGFSCAATMTNAWMASPSHMYNIVYPDYSRVGIGVVDGYCAMILCS